MKVGLLENLVLFEELKAKLESWNINIAPPESCDVLIASSAEDALKFSKEYILWTDKDDSEHDLFSLLNAKCIGRLKPSVLNNDSGIIVLKRLLGIPSSLRPEESYGSKVSKMSSLFVDQTNSLGKGLDKITAVAGDFGVSVSDVGMSVMGVLHYLSTLTKSEKCDLPFEIDYGFTQNDFFVQIHCHAENVDKADIYLGFSEKRKDKTYTNILSDTLSRTDILNIYTITKNNRLVITCIWNKNANQKYEQMLCLDFGINTIQEEKIEYNESEKYTSKEVIPTDDPSYKGSALPTYEELNSGKLVRLKRFVTFIKNLRKKEVTSVALNDLSTKHITNYLKKYPRTDAVNLIDENDKKFILKCLLDNELDFSFNDNFKKIIEGKHDDDFYKNILSTVEKLTLDDLNEIAVTEDLYTEGESVTKVRSWVQEEDKHKEVIRGTREDIGENQHKTVVKGSIVVERPEDQKWTIKRSEIVSNLKEKLMTLKTNQSSHQEVEEEVKKTLSHFLNIDGNETNTIVKNVFEFAAEPLVSLKIGSKSEDIKERLEIEKSRLQSNAKDDQIKRMKRIIDGMKTQMIAMKQQEQNQEKTIEYVPYNDNTPIELKLHNEKIEKENDTLREQLEMAERRNVALSENMDRLRNERHLKDEQKEKVEAERELALKGNLSEERKQRLLAIRESRNLERKVHELEALVESLKKASSEGELAILKESLNRIQADLEASRNDCKKFAHEANENGLLLKKLEHKNKILQGQLEETNKKLSQNGNGTQGKGSTGAAEVKLKQMERVNQKLSASNKKSADDLSDKKKEVIELNKEIIGFKNKVQELERKLLKAEKQAA